MSRREPRQVPADLANAARRFQTWRSTRNGKTRIPETLWRRAMILAQKHGVARTASQLRLDYYALKKRIPQRQQADEAKPAFVQIPVAPAAQCSLEIHDQDGACMRLALQGYGADDLAQLGRTLWETQQCCKSRRK